MKGLAVTALTTLSIFLIVATVFLYFAPPEYLPYKTAWLGIGIALTVASVVACFLLVKAAKKNETPSPED